MLGSHPISAMLGADLSATSDTADIRAYLKGLTDVGLHVLLCKPGTKEPADYRTKKQVEEDDAEWEARTGVPGLRKPCGVHMATDDLNRLRGYVNRFRKKLGDGAPDENGNPTPTAPVTLAISVEPSKLLIVDTDTAAQRQAFCDWMVEKTGNPLLGFTVPTVLSPGVMKNGEWVHKDGGHFYFSVDDISLPASHGKMSVTYNEETFDIFWRDRYVLIPPSERAEGKYQRIGPVISLRDHPWFVAEIENYDMERTQKRRDEEACLDPETREALVSWYQDVSWARLLEPLGWELTGQDSVCGCETWGRPGRSHDKSATAHQVGCPRAEYAGSQDPPIHFWTTTPGREIRAKLDEVGGTTLSKLQLYSAVEFAGDDGQAMASIPDLPRRRAISVELPDNMPFGMSSGALRFIPDLDDIASREQPPESVQEVVQSVDTTGVSIPAYGQPPNVPQPTTIYAPTPAIHPATDSATPAPAYTGTVPPFVQGGFPSKNLGRPASFHALAEQSRLAQIAMNADTGAAMNSNPVPAMERDTNTLTPRYGDQYGNSHTCSEGTPTGNTGLSESQLDAVASVVADKLASTIAERVLDEIRKKF